MEKEKMKFKKVLALFALGTAACFLPGCRETPEKSAVVSKADGLDESVIAAPLEEGQTRKADMPKHWSAKHTSSDGKMTITADLDLEAPQLGNLPVLEMKNHKMTQEELEKLVHYFAEGQDLFVPRADTKEVYQKILDRIEKGEGAYSNEGDLYNMEIKGYVEKGLELAPETSGPDQKAEVVFQKKSEDAARNAAKGRAAETKEQENYFVADIGKGRESCIEAVTYDPDSGNDSSFSWKTGEAVSDELDIQYYLRWNESGNTEYAARFQELAERFHAALEKETVTEEEGEVQARQVMEELELPEMRVSSLEKILWFPKGSIPEEGSPGNSEDFLWQADLSKAAAGYRYTFTRKTNGLFLIRGGMALNGTGEVYAPPFPVETVQITVTENGVQAFSWEGISEESAIVAENTELLEFEEIQEWLFKQITYWYTQKKVPPEENMRFSYPVIGAEIGYTYIPAYEKPDCVWMVPAWNFQVMEQVNGRDMQYLEWTINALDGGVVGEILN